MPFAWPTFLRRLFALRRADRAISAGDYGQALDVLRAPALSSSDRARELREIALESLCRCAGFAIASGDVEAARRALAIVARDDATRGIAWGRRLALVAPAEESAPERPIVRLLGEMRARRSEAAGSAASTSETGRAIEPTPSHNGVGGTCSPRSMSSEPVAEPSTVRFQVEVDDGGQLLAIASAQVVIGHLRSAAADLRFLADVEAEHVRLVRRDSFHAGPSWEMERAFAREVRVNGRVLDGPSLGLYDGDEVTLARNLSFRFRQPQASSQSAVIELLRGAECDGALKILLFAPDEAGVVRIGSKRDRHIALADIEHEISLKLSGSELWIHCDGGVRRAEGTPAGESSTTVVLACPPTTPQHLLVRARARARAPLGISLRPAANTRERA